MVTAAAAASSGTPAVKILRRAETPLNQFVIGLRQAALDAGA